MPSASTALETPSLSNTATLLVPQRDPASSGLEAATESLIKQHLRKSSYTSLRSINCQVSAGTARLSGRLPSYYLKQTAQEIVRRVDGVDQVHNHLEVIEHPQT